MHKSMAAYTYIYGKAVELLQHPVEKKQNQHFQQKSARDFVHGIERRSCDIPKQDIINIPVWYARVKRWAYEIKGAERKRGISQLKLAMDLGLNQNSISRYESGAREADYKTLIALADYFDVSIDYLLERTDKPKMNR